MAEWLRQSTSVTTKLGPFVDKTDGVALEVGLATAMDNATTGIRVSKNGGTYADRNDATAPSYDAMGDYNIVLSTTDTNTLGKLRIIFEEAATTLPVWKDFMVVPAVVYDAIVLGTDNLDVNVVQWLGTAAATPTTAGVPEVDVTYWNATLGSDDNYPSTQSQLAGISNVGSATHIAFTGETLTTPATTTSGSYTDTEALDGVYMNWDSVTGGFDAELTGNIGAGTPSGIKITGYMNGANDAVRVQMWDYQAGTPAWVTIGPWSGGGSSINQVLPYDAFVGMVGIGANLGNIRLRLYNDNGVADTALTSANIYI